MFVEAVVVGFNDKVSVCPTEGFTDGSYERVGIIVGTKDG
jgi:hypothetical protein